MRIAIFTILVATVMLQHANIRIRYLEGNNHILELRVDTLVNKVCQLNPKEELCNAHDRN